jgi:serine/threonine protein kinase
MEVAIKEIREITEKGHKHLMKEYNLMKTLPAHPNLVPILGSVIVEGHFMYIITPHIPLGDLKVASFQVFHLFFFFFSLSVSNRLCWAQISKSQMKFL